MPIKETPSGQPDTQTDKDKRTSYVTLGQIFDGKNKARIVAEDNSLIDPNGRYALFVFDRELSEKYQPLFGQTGRIKEASERFTEIPNILDMFGGERYYEYDYAEEEYLHPGDPEQMTWIRHREAKRAADLLFSPSTDPAQIEARQRLLGELSESPDLDELLRLRDESYGMFLGLGMLQWNVNYVKTEIKHTNPGFMRFYHDGIDKLIDLYHGGVATQIGISEHPGAEESWERGEIVEIRDLNDVVMTAADQIKDGANALGALLEKLEPDSVFRQSLLHYPELMRAAISGLSEVVPFDPEGKPDPEKHFWPSPFEVVEETERKFYSRLIEVGAVLELARKIRDEGWGKVTFDQDLPYGYTGGWSLDLKKKAQVHNDSPDDAPITVLSGANTSGKSFFMNTDMLIRIAGQSLGFAPVESANLPVMKRFIHLDRAYTNSFNDLSAFMSEVKDWVNVLANIGPGTRLYVDEGYSTTSPEDQSRLLMATVKYVNGLGGSVMLATHNEVVLADSEIDPNTRIYHLETAVGKNGEFIRKFKLAPGASESMALIVARRRNFPGGLVDIAKGYLDGEFLVLPENIVHSYPEVVPFTEEERERLKHESVSLDRIFPPEKTKDLIFSLLSNDPEFSIDEFLRNLMPNYERRGLLDFDKLHASAELISRMILRVGSLSPAEILERQRLFQELTGEKQKKVLEATQVAGHIDEVYKVIVAHINEGVGLNFIRGRKIDNDERNKRLKPEFQKPFEIHFSPTELKTSIAFLRIQQKFAGDTFLHGELLDSFIALSTQIGDREFEKDLTDSEKTTYTELIMQLTEIPDDFIRQPFGKIKIEDIKDELADIQNYHGARKDESVVRNLEEENSLAYALLIAGQEFSAARTLINTLRTIDSIYLQQAASYLEIQLDNYMRVLRGEDTDDSIPNTRSLISSLFFDRGNSPVNQTVNQIRALCAFSDVIKEKGLVPVELNDTGEVRFDNSFSIFKEKDDQVRNSVGLTPDQRVEILTGPNGSGKTFYEKDAVALVLTALATGFAPADFATLPVFDGVAYLDRVTQKNNSKLSSFAQDIEYWKEILELTEGRRAVFAVVDEAFSSTSPTYQQALTFAAVANILGRENHHLVLTTHNHELVDKLVSLYQGSVQINHFKFRVVGEEIIFEYKKEPGHEYSHALEVAKKMGLPGKILSQASNYTPKPKIRPH